MGEYSLKLDKFLIPIISKIKNPIILELGVENGVSTIKFLEICKLNNGKLYSVDIKDCSKVTNNKIKTTCINILTFGEFKIFKSDNKPTEKINKQNRNKKL